MGITPTKKYINLPHIICKILHSLLIFLSPRRKLLFLLELEQRLYFLTDQVACNFGNGIHPKHWQTKYHDFFCNRVRKDERVIDIGCGNGYLAYDIAIKSKAKVLGVDISDENINIAQKKFGGKNVNFVRGDVQKDLPNESFDVAVLSNVLEHVKNRSDFLKRLQLVLKPKRWLIRVPLYERDWRVPLMEEVGVDYRSDPTHFIEYTQESLQKELHEAGLQIAHQEIRWGEIWCEAKPIN